MDGKRIITNVVDVVGDDDGHLYCAVVVGIDVGEGTAQGVGAIEGRDDALVVAIVDLMVPVGLARGITGAGLGYGRRERPAPVQQRGTIPVAIAIQLVAIGVVLRVGDVGESHLWCFGVFHGIDDDALHIASSINEVDGKNGGRFRGIDGIRVRVRCVNSFIIA